MMEEGKVGLVKRLMNLPLHKTGRVFPEPTIRTEPPKVETTRPQVFRVKNQGSVRSRR